MLSFQANVGISRGTNWDFTNNDAGITNAINQAQDNSEKLNSVNLQDKRIYSVNPKDNRFNSVNPKERRINSVTSGGSEPPYTCKTFNESAVTSAIEISDVVILAVGLGR